MNTHDAHRTKRRTGSALLMTGLLSVMLGSGLRGQYSASLSGKGSMVTEKPAQEVQLVQGHAAAMVIQDENPASGIGMIAFGMLMMLLGFGLHALIVLREHEEDRSVPVHVRTRKHDAKEPRKTRRQFDVIWVERTIRF